LFQAGELAQFARQQHAAVAVQFTLRRVAAHHLLGAAALFVEIGKLRELLFNDLPGRQRVKPQAAIERI
jgi:hypothetical protein